MPSSVDFAPLAVIPNYVTLIHRPGILNLCYVLAYVSILMTDES